MFSRSFQFRRKASSGAAGQGIGYELKELLNRAVCKDPLLIDKGDLYEEF